MIVCILGRQPELGLAELSALYPSTSLFSNAAVCVDVDTLDIQTLGGSQKAGRVIKQLPTTDWAKVSREIIRHYQNAWSSAESKVTFGMSIYGAPAPRLNDLNRLTSTLKRTIKQTGTSIRHIPNSSIELNTAVSHHNKLGLHPRKVEIMVVIGKQQTIIAESIGAQNITALARRDQGRPKRDAFIGMLPPKLALMMVNMGLGATNPTTAQILDPFCGTGVVLQEAYLRGATVHGSDLNPKMISFSEQNLEWLTKTHRSQTGRVGHIAPGDAMKHTWPFSRQLTAVVCETYLGQPFSATPSAAKLSDVRRNCHHIVNDFLHNISRQLSANARLCVAVPAWRNLSSGAIHRLSLENSLEAAGLTQLNDKPLLYYRDDQVVARDILVLKKS